MMDIVFNGKMPLFVVSGDFNRLTFKIKQTNANSLLNCLLLLISVLT